MTNYKLPNEIPVDQCSAGSFNGLVSAAVPFWADDGLLQSADNLLQTIGPLFVWNGVGGRCGGSRNAIVRRRDGRFRFDDNIRQRDDNRVLFVVVGFQRYPNRLTGLQSRWCAGHDGRSDVTGAGRLVKRELAAATACRCRLDVGRLLVGTEIHVHVTFVIASGTRFPAVRLLRLHLGHGVEQDFGQRRESRHQTARTGRVPRMR